MPTSVKRLTLTIGEGEYAEWESEAKRHGLTITAMVRLAVRALALAPPTTAGSREYGGKS